MANKNCLTFYPQLCEITLKADVTKGLSLLEKMHPRWGGRGLMELSYIGHLRAVIASKFISIHSGEYVSRQNLENNK